jgi:hypothetical protein
MDGIDVGKAEWLSEARQRCAEIERRSDLESDIPPCKYYGHKRDWACAGLGEEHGRRVPEGRLLITNEDAGPGVPCKACVPGASARAQRSWQQIEATHELRYDSTMQSSIRVSMIDSDRL